jgi:hypothetical protein
MAVMWFYAEQGQQKGPVTEEEFKRLAASGTIRPETLLWREGLAHWQSYAETADAPLPEVVAVAASAARTCSECGQAFAPEDLVLLGGRDVCAGCKPILLQRLREGAAPPVGGRQRRPLPVNPQDLIAEIRARDYRIDLGQILPRTWKLYRANFWPCVGATAVVMALSWAAGLVPYLGAIISLFISAPLMAGLYIYMFRLVRGEAHEVGDVFAGFSPSWWKYVLVNIVIAIPVAVPAFLVGIGVAMFFGLDIGQPHPVLVTALICAGALALALIIYLNVGLWFALPLVTDLQLGPIDAAITSLRAVNLHWFQVLLLLLVSLLLASLGLLALCIGLFFALPLFWLATVLAYEEIFGVRPHGATDDPTTATP